VHPHRHRYSQASRCAMGGGSTWCVWSIVHARMHDASWRVCALIYSCMVWPWLLLFCYICSFLLNACHGMMVYMFGYCSIFQLAATSILVWHCFQFVIFAQTLTWYKQYNCSNQTSEMTALTHCHSQNLYTNDQNIVKKWQQ
jgi:hypothetical protein